MTDTIAELVEENEDSQEWADIDEATQNLDPWSVEAAIEEPAMEPPRITIYGTHGVGKTTLAKNMPRPFALFTEPGKAALRIRSFPQVAKTWEEFTKGLGRMIQLANSPKRDFDTGVIDSLDWLQPIVWAETCRRNDNAPSIESYGYGKGYMLADEVWSEVFAAFDMLHDAGIMVVLIAHDEVMKFTPPESDPYDRHDIALHRRARAMVHEWSDVVAFAHERTSLIQKEEGFGKSKKTITRGGGTIGRYLALERRSTHEAKNRYNLPAELPLRNDDSTANELLAGIAAAYTTES